MITSTELNNGTASEPIPTEVREKTRRRPFSADYKRRIIAEIDAAPRGVKGQILRREGLWAGSITTWRNEVNGSLEPRKHGRRPSPETALKKEYEKLRRENERLKVKLEHAGLIIAAQKKVARLFEEMDEKNDSA